MRRVEKGVCGDARPHVGRAGRHLPLRQTRYAGKNPRGHHRQLDPAHRRRSHRGDGRTHGRGARLARMADAAARADGGPHRPPLEIRRASGAATSGHRRTIRSPAALPTMATRTSPPTSPTRPSPTPSRTASTNITTRSPARARRAGLLHELHAGDHDARRARQGAPFEAARRSARETGVRQPERTPRDSGLSLARLSARTVRG